MQLENVIEIDGVPVKVENERNLLEVISKAGIKLPVFCYHSDLSIFGACRMCMVEDEKGHLMAACSTIPKSGMKIKTNTGRLRKYRKNILELLLASHCRDCTTCEKSGKCTLQQLAVQCGIKTVRFPNDKPETRIDDSSACITIDRNKCILCGDCVRECNEKQHVGVIDIAFRGSKAEISTAFGIPIADTNCVGCGQCAAACPTGAIVVKDNTEELWKVLDDEETFVTCEIAPAVRVGVGQDLGLIEGENYLGRIIAALHRMGFDQVYDTSTAADITVIEEANEFVERLKKGENLPLFTSCCPAWVKYVETKYPEFVPNISTCKSPMGMFASILKEYYKDKLPEGKKRHVHVALMPCTAKKGEAKREEFIKDGDQLTNIVITTQELIRMIKRSGIMFDELEPEAIDVPFGIRSGAGIIFGVTGGVTEAVLRRLIKDDSMTTLRQIEFTGVRGLEGLKEATIPYEGRELHIAVVSGLLDARKVLKAMQKGEMKYDLIEVMACKDGCISGGGQPYISHRHRKLRAEGLYRSDKTTSIKRPQDNPIIDSIYDNIIKDNVHEILHVDYVKK